MLNKQSSIANPKVTFVHVPPPLVVHTESWNFRSTVQALTGHEASKMSASNIHHMVDQYEMSPSDVAKEDENRHTQSLCPPQLCEAHQHKELQNQIVDCSVVSGEPAQNEDVTISYSYDVSTRDRGNTSRNVFRTDMSTVLSTNDNLFFNEAFDMFSHFCHNDEVEDLFPLPELQLKF
ncbi:hypothetical protein KP509_27G019200 [Ceratopteris richardii]|uniref:VQ domain-containing protein n=1 Tax=Ceratopteris richardii TaxID=49495 RepID=A0A8T2RFQ7_CERRI|nr:hypothetical protein KP509_27G019200 [Ceratopteris richardii]